MVCVEFWCVSHHRHNNSPTQFPNQNPHEPNIRTHRGPIQLSNDDGDGEFLIAFSLFCFLLAIIGIGFVGVFTTGIVGGILSLSSQSHRHRAEGEISPSPKTWNEQDGDDLWVTKQRGLGFSMFIWNRFLIFGWGFFRK